MRLRSARWVAALALVAAPLLTGAAPSPQPVLVLSGKGHGHGVGMAQDSANAMAAAGLSHEQILSHFYPGTGRAVRRSSIRVSVWQADAPTGEVTLAVPGGAQVRGSSGSATARPGAVLRVSLDATGYHVREEQPSPTRPVVLRAGLVVEPSPSPSQSDGPPPLLPPAPSASPSPSPTGSAPPPSTRPSPGPASPRPPGASPTPSPTAAPLSLDSSGPVTVDPAGATTRVLTTGRTYRGTVTALTREGFRLVNAVDIEDYLLGLGEVPAGWPMAALRTQAVAARTYALRSAGNGGPGGYDICDDTRCQVYIGVGNESPRTAQAARDTAGEVVTYRGSLADTFYSANAGGVTASPGEGFGGSATIPYLRAGIRAPGGVDAWSLRAAPQDVAARLGYAGRLDGMTVVGKGPSGRVTRVRVDGAAGPKELTGIEVQRALGLRSTLFTVSRGTGAAQALPSPGAAALQLPPTQAAAPDPVPEALVAPAPAPDAVADAYALDVRLPVLPVGAAGVLVLLSGAAVGWTWLRRS